jgi:hypothetical protein
MTEPSAVERSTGEPPSSVGIPDDPIVRADLAGTVALAVISLVTALVADTATEITLLVVSGALFLGGIVAFGIGFLRLADRSRHEVVDLGGSFYLTGSAPQPIRRWMLGLWFAQIAIAAVSAFAIHPPFGLLGTVWGIGLNPLWASRHGTFPRRERDARA